jgi:hypothetical protein
MLPSGSKASKPKKSKPLKLCTTGHFVPPFKQEFKERK